VTSFVTVVRWFNNPRLLYATLTTVDVKCLCGGSKMSHRSTSLCSYTFMSTWHISLLSMNIFNNKLMKGKALRKHSLHEKTAASVLLKLFISGNE